MLVGIEPEVWKEGDGMVRARLRCSIWILAVLRRLLDILSMRGVQPCVCPPYVYIIIIAVSLSIVWRRGLVCDLFHDALSYLTVGLLYKLTHESVAMCSRGSF